MASLTGSSIASTYKDLLQVSNSNSGIDGTARVVSDGEDTASKLFLDTNRVGVGIAPTDGTLHVHTATAGSVAPDGDADDLVVENSASGGISILTPDANPGRLAFGSPSDAYGAVIMHQQSTGKLSINTEGSTGNISMATGSGTTAMTIDSSQRVGIGVTPSDYYANYDNLVLGATSGHTGATIVSGSSNSGTIAFADGTSDQAQYEGEIGYNHNSNFLFLNTAGSYRMKITSTGDVQLQERLTFSDTTTTATASINLHSNNYLYVTGGTSGLSLTAEGGADKIQIEDGGGSGRILFECTNTQVAKFDTNSRISLSNNDSSGEASSTFLGYQAGSSIADGAHKNLAIGHQALYQADACDDSIAIGYQALAGTDAGTNEKNIAIGNYALDANMVHNTNNIAIGHNSLTNLTGSGAIYNTFIGTDSGLSLTNADYNTGVGTGVFGEASGNAITGEGNSALGALAGYNLEGVAHSNTLIGYGAGNASNAITTGISNVCIGDGASTSSATADNQISIGTGAVGQGDNSVTLGNGSVTDVYMASDQRAKMHSGQIETIMDSSTNANIAVIRSENTSNFSSSVLVVTGDRTTTNSSYNLANFTNAGTAKFIVRDSGNTENTNNSYGAISDEKLKQDIADASSQWDDIKAVRFRKFKFKDMVEDGFKLGVVAQELEKVSPNLISEAIDRDVDGKDLGTTTKSVKYSILQMKGLVALQEAMKRIEELEAKVTELEKK
jgi:hypothetical protein